MQETREMWVRGLIPALERFPGGGHGNPLQYSCLENAMDQGAWQATVHRVTKNWTWLKQLSTHAGDMKIFSVNICVQIHYRFWWLHNIALIFCSTVPSLKDNKVIFHFSLCKESHDECPYLPSLCTLLVISFGYILGNRTAGSKTSHILNFRTCCW